METQPSPKERRKLSKRLCLSEPQFPLSEHKLQVFHDHEVAVSIKQMHLTKCSAAGLTPLLQKLVPGTPSPAPAELENSGFSRRRAQRG